MNFTLTITIPAREPGGEAQVEVSNPLEKRDQLHTVAYWALRRATPWRHADELSRYAGQIVNRPLGMETVESTSGLKFRVDEYKPGAREVE